LLEPTPAAAIISTPPPFAIITPLLIRFQPRAIIAIDIAIDYAAITITG